MGVGGHVAPEEQRDAAARAALLEDTHTAGDALVILREEEHGHAVIALGGKQMAAFLRFFSEEPVGNLEEDARAVARVLIESDAAAMLEVDEHGKYIEKDNTDERTRRDINRDARLAAKDFLDCLEDYDASSWDPENSTHIVRGIIKYKDKPITVAILSSRKRKLYLHPRLFAELMQDSDNLLLNYGYDDRIHSLSFDSIFKDNPNVNLIFDTDYVSAKEIAELANKYMNSKKTCFVVENINYSQDERIKSFGLNETKKDGSAWTDLSDEDIFDFGED